MPLSKTKVGAPGTSKAKNLAVTKTVPLQRRKRKAGEQRFYAVRAGKIPGVYLTWAECQAMVNGYPGANYKSFGTREEAELYAAGKNPNPGTAPSRFYAVAIGNRPGIYTEWTEAQAAYTGVKAPKYKKFDSREAAEAWMDGFQIPGMKHLTEEYEDDEPEDEVQEKTAKKRKTTGGGIAVAVKSDPEDLLEIHTDGSSLANGETGAVAGVGVFFGIGDPRNISEGLQGTPQTNQRAELTAILRALETVPIDRGVMIRSDSKYAINCVTQWFVRWEKNGWMTHKGQVQNRDLVEAVLAKIRQREIEGSPTLFRWVKGHESSMGNILADKLAVGAAKQARFSQVRNRRH